MDDDAVQRRQIDADGLIGALWIPADAGVRPLPAVLTLGGSEGGLREAAARAFTREGFAALALAYFGVDSLPAELVEVPLEYVDAALAWLARQPEVDGRRIAVVGGSKGGELALLVGATYPEQVCAVVAYVPSAIVWQGITFSRQAMRAGPRSSWMHHGQPLPFVPYATPTLRVAIGLLGFLLGRPTKLRPTYERALDDEAAVERAMIPVERINGPVVVVSGTDDQLWPSTTLAQLAVDRLARHDHPHTYRHLRYERAGHLVTVPGAMPTPDDEELSRFALGGDRRTDEAASEDAWPHVLDVLRRRFDELVG